MSKLTHLGVVFALLALAACAPGQTVNAGSAGGRADLLTEEQIRGQSFSTAFEVVQALRPNWLRTRGTDSFRSPGQIQVYVDNMRLGGINTLQQIPTVSVYWIRWYDGIDASARWGLDHGNGVIFVSTSRENRES